MTNRSSYMKSLFDLENEISQTSIFAKHLRNLNNKDNFNKETRDAS